MNLDVAIECAIGGVYEIPDGRMFWIDAPVAREIALRVLESDAVSRRLALLQEAFITLRHAQVFISSREKMHADGQALYQDLLQRLSEVTSNDGLKELTANA